MLCCAWSLSHIWLFVSPWTVICQTLSTRILQARILEWVVICRPPGDLPNPGTEPRSPTLQMDSPPYEPQGSPRILEWVAYPFSRGSSQPRNPTGISCIAGRFLFFFFCRQILYQLSYQGEVQNYRYFLINIHSPFFCYLLKIKWSILYSFTIYIITLFLKKL